MKGVTQMCHFSEVAECCDQGHVHLAVAEQEQEQPEVLLSQTPSASPRVSLCSAGILPLQMPSQSLLVFKRVPMQMGINHSLDYSAVELILEIVRVNPLTCHLCVCY